MKRATVKTTVKGQNSACGIVKTLHRIDAFDRHIVHISEMIGRSVRAGRVARINPADLCGAACQTKGQRRGEPIRGSGDLTLFHIIDENLDLVGALRIKLPVESECGRAVRSDRLFDVG